MAGSLPNSREAFAEYCGVRHAVAVSNGTAALHLCLVALDVRAGDEIIVPSLTYVATANAVRYCNATPVFVDNDLAHLQYRRRRDRGQNHAPHKRNHAGSSLWSSGRYGSDPRDCRETSAVRRRRCRRSHWGALQKPSRGGIGTCATFSFFGNKIITTGEGGMVTTNDDALAARLRMFKGQGMDPDRRYWFPVIGYNYRMTNIAAAIGLAQLERIEHHLETRKAIAAGYNRRLGHLSEQISVAGVGEMGQPCLLDVHDLAAQRRRAGSGQCHASARRTRHRDTPGILSDAHSSALSRRRGRPISARRSLRRRAVSTCRPTGA